MTKYGNKWVYYNGNAYFVSGTTNDNEYMLITPSIKALKQVKLPLDAVLEEYIFDKFNIGDTALYYHEGTNEYYACKLLLIDANDSYRPYFIKTNGLTKWISPIYLYKIDL